MVSNNRTDCIFELVGPEKRATEQTILVDRRLGFFRNEPKVVWLSLAVVLVGAPMSGADTISIGALKDNTLFQDTNGQISNGGGQHFFSGTTGSGAVRRGLLAFDVAAAVPAGSVIDSATLTLHMSRTISGSVPVSLHQVLADWGEGGSDADGEEGGGTQAVAGDATWKHRFFDTASWTSEGGDFDPTVRATTDVSGLGSYNWSSTLLAADVQDWLDSPVNNFGWLVMANETLGGTAKRFDSSENGVTTFQPVLTIQYTVPEPASLCLMAVAIVPFLRSRFPRKMA